MKFFGHLEMLFKPDFHTRNILGTKLKIKKFDSRGFLTRNYLFLLTHNFSNS